MVLFFREVDLSSQSSFTYVSALSGSTQCRLAAAPLHPHADRTPCMTLIWGPATCPATSSFQAGPTCFSSAPCCTEIVPRELQTQRQVCHAANEAKKKKIAFLKFVVFLDPLVTGLTVSLKTEIQKWANRERPSLLCQECNCIDNWLNFTVPFPHRTMGCVASSRAASPGSSAGL